MSLKAHPLCSNCLYFQGQPYFPYVPSKSLSDFSFGGHYFFNNNSNVFHTSSHSLGISVLLVKSESCCKQWLHLASSTPACGTAEGFSVEVQDMLVVGQLCSSSLPLIKGTNALQAFKMKEKQRLENNRLQRTAGEVELPALNSGVEGTTAGIPII